MIIALSFDDGYREHLKVARELATMGIRATFFVITHLRYWMGKPLLSHDEIAEIAEMGHEIGSHTCAHPDLTELPRDKLEWELKTSKRYLEDITGKEVLGLAYPFGKFNDRVVTVTKKYYYYARALRITTNFMLYHSDRYSIDAIANIPTLQKIVRTRQLWSSIKGMLLLPKGRGFLVLCAHDRAPLAMHTIDTVKLLAFVRLTRHLIQFVPVYELVLMQEL